ncbi:hypothetical protein [Leptospira harrisiae]|uniref:hypothetical protein n=1 Tax=Leptospira harrisiae TaxID=2023189 RepID=UPI001FAFE926|nr:hypothetical protein [Leptospira harrisiae]
MAKPESNSFFKRSIKSVLWIFLTQTKVSKIEQLTEGFFLVEMTGTKLKETKWIPGSKVQVDVGNLIYRTYTPISKGHTFYDLTHSVFAIKIPLANERDSI